MSISSNLLKNITLYRNPNGPVEEWAYSNDRKLKNITKARIAEIGYIAVIPFAIIECSIATIADIFSFCLPIGRQNYAKINQWQKSSFFSIIWALGNASINLYCNDLVETEEAARACAFSGDIFSIPYHAIKKRALFRIT